MNRTVLHVDMDAFFAAVEQRDHPEYRGKPVIVGSDPKNGKGRGIVATCSYEARRFGVHSAQPISKAWRLCPQGIYVRPGMAKYLRASRSIMDIFQDFTDLVEQVSIDEAFLDVSGSDRLYGSGPQIARMIKDRIFHEQRLTASVGVAANKFVAKVASDLLKPDGLVVVDPGQEREFLAPLPISRLWGVGAKTEALLKGMGIERMGQMAGIDQAEMVRHFGKGGQHLWGLAQGIDDRPVAPDESFKSIGHEVTFDRDTADPKVLHDTLLELTEKVAERLRCRQARARTVVLKYREADFSTYTRRKTLETSADTLEEIFPTAQTLMCSLLRPGILVRLLGVYAANLEMGHGAQLSLFRNAQAKERRLAAAMDDITRRYGGRAITRAALVSPSGKQNRAAIAPEREDSK
jgi:DNA polymerase IV